MRKAIKVAGIGPFLVTKRKERKIVQFNEAASHKSEFPTLKSRFAKTMPETPPLVRVRIKENEDKYVKLFHRTAEQGVWEEFQGRRYQYLYIGPFKYWRMTNLRMR